MKTQQAEWFLCHDFSVTEGGTEIYVDFVDDKAIVSLANGENTYKAVLNEYPFYHSKEKVDLAIGGLVYHFENLIQTR